MQNQNLNAKQSYRTLVIIWAALFMAQFLFLVVVYFARPQVFRFDFSKPLLDEHSFITVALFIVAISNFVMSLVLRRKYLAQAEAEQSIGMVQNAMIVGCALCEGISIFGLLLVFLHGYQYFFLFFALAILGFFLHFPRRAN